MRALLTSLINIAQRTGRFTVAEATDIYDGLWRILWFTLLTCIAVFMLNALLGWTTPSLVLAITFAIATVYLWAKPLHILVVAGVGLASRIATDAPLAREVENALRAYLGFLKWVLFAGITFLFISGTISFRENPGAMLPVLVGLSVAGLCIWLWPKMFLGVWARKLVYWYAVAIVVLSFGSLIPGAVWAKYTGWDPENLRPSLTEASLYRMDRIQRELTDADRAEKLESITDKIKRHEKLTEEDKKVVAEARRLNAKPAATAQKQVQPAAETGTLTMPANGISARVKTKSGYMISYDGSGFSVHCVYRDGSEGVAAWNGKNLCKDGPMQYQYVRDVSGKANSVTYEFVRP